MHWDFVVDVPRSIFADVCSDPQTTLVEMDGDDDPVHLLVEYLPQLAISSLVNSLEGVPVTCCANSARSGAPS
jgi:putative transposase